MRLSAISSFALLGLLSLASPIAAQSQTDSEGRQTGSFTNGRVWRPMTEGEKIFLITGMQDGLIVGKTVAAHTECPQKQAYDQYFCNCTVGEIVAGVDKFFEEPAYRQIPIVAAVRVYVMKAKGAAQTEIDAEIQRLLRTISAPEPK